MVFRREVLEGRLEALKKYQRDLCDLLDGADFLAYKADVKQKYAVERLCHLISESILDCLEYLLVAKFEVNPVSYRQILDFSYENGILDGELYEELQGMPGFRNVLVHRYIDVDDEVIYSNAKKFVVVLPKIIEQLGGRR